MTTISYSTALIVGAGSASSASVARGLAAAGLKVGVAARNVDKLASLAAADTGAERFGVDASDPAAVAHLFEEADARLGTPDVVLYNASARAHGPITELDLEAVRDPSTTTKGFGFIAPDQGGKDIFVHATALERSGIMGLMEGQRVAVDVADGQKGPEAVSQPKADLIPPFRMAGDYPSSDFTISEDAVCRVVHAPSGMTTETVRVPRDPG